MSGVNFKSSILREKAIKTVDVMGIEDFTASNDWMGRFRVRHGIFYCQVNSEADSMNPADIENWVVLLLGIFNSHAPRDDYNVNEMNFALRYNV